MRLWQQAMISLALNHSIKNFVQNNRSASVFARRFVGAVNELEIIQKAEDLRSKGTLVSFFHLGEYVKDKDKILQTIESLIKVIKGVGNTGLDNNISIDPTQAGLLQGFSFCRNNLIKLASYIQSTSDSSIRTSARNYLMIDMEDASVTQATLDLYATLIDRELPAALTLQAALFRTENDLEQIFRHPGAVRLVKGAFAEKSSICHTDKKKIDHQYLNLGKKMLLQNTSEKGFYPIFGTHDHHIIYKLIAHARENNISSDQYEFEMLFGVRPNLQADLIRKKQNIRVYLPYGKDFWPYAVRRIGENPKNIRFLARSLFPE